MPQDNSADLMKAMIAKLYSTITGNEIITKTGNGTLKLSGTSNFSGVTNLQGGTLQVAGGGAISDSSVVTLSANRPVVFELLASETIAGIAAAKVSKKKNFTNS